MKKLKLALVGRPNVGKSALFNRICGKRQSIVDEAEGTTRDRLYGETDFFGQPLSVIDTGGIDVRKGALFGEEIRQQAEIAVVEADAIVMVVDAKAGITPLDKEVAKILHHSKKPITLAVNKIDDLGRADGLHAFYSLGIPKMVAVSATQGHQIAELLETALAGLKPLSGEMAEESDTIKVAIVGRPNVGKSTLLNTLLSEDRSVVSPVAGTTRDAIDAEVIREGFSYTFIDTAGIRRKKSEHEVVDKFAAIRTQEAIERSDVCLLMLESSEGLTAQDKKIASMIEEAGKGCILLFNKWDLTEGFRMEHCDKAIQEEASFLKHCPRLFISAQKKRNLTKIFPLIQEVYRFQQERITTGQLNKFVERAIQLYHPPMIQGKRLRIYYMTQVDVQPPTFVLFVNYPHLMLDTYKQYLVGKFRETYQFTGNPLVFNLKGRHRKEFHASGDSFVVS
ncbi:MAG: ribosome biogenesis GTPase Der [Verrucomicrobia bacterium]|nr:ribosome biogenesis GTPase Der [Verrucomicrobiota bacterium]